MFPVEEIPDEDSLFRRYNFEMHTHKKGLSIGKLKANAFRETGEGPTLGMSCDWEKYSSAELTRSRVASPSEWGVVKLSVGSLRRIKLSVFRNPENPSENNPIGNQAHSLVRGLSIPDESNETTLRAKILLDCAPEIVF